MGTDKALLPVGEQEPSASCTRAKREKYRHVTVIVGASERYSSYGDTIEDQLPGCGPLGGIHAALCATQNDLNLVLSVDMPLMTAAFSPGS